MNQLQTRKENMQYEMSADKVDLIKKTYCKNSTNDELELFLHTCKKTGLDPCMKQIYFVKFGDKVSIQTGIDGLRLIADRSGKYCPGKETTFQYDANAKLFSATSYIKKLTADGIWHEVSATAVFSEYKPPRASDFWNNKPHIMLAKCAEALALRKAFPAEMSGLYTQEEMAQADIPIQETKEIETVSVKVSAKQAQDLAIVLSECPNQYVDSVHTFMKNQKMNGYEHIPVELYEKILTRAMVEREKFIKELQTSEEPVAVGAENELF